MTYRPCAAIGCTELVVAGRCATHSREQNQRRRPTAELYGRAWQRWRKAFIATIASADPFCQNPECGRPFTSTSEIELHHKLKAAEHPEALMDSDNVSWLCAACHSALTMEGF